MHTKSAKEKVSQYQLYISRNTIFYKKWAWPTPAGWDGGGFENDILCTSTQQYGHDKKESKTISLLVFKLQGGTERQTDRQTDNADHIGFFVNPKNANITPKI